MEAFDLLVSQGYYTHMHAIPCPPSHIMPGGEQVTYRIEVSSLHFDRIDLRHLVEQGDKLDLEVTVGRMSQGSIDFSEPDRTPEVVRNPRRHPR